MNKKLIVLLIFIFCFYFYSYSLVFSYCISNICTYPTIPDSILKIKDTKDDYQVLINSMIDTVDNMLKDNNITEDDYKYIIDEIYAIYEKIIKEKEISELNLINICNNKMDNLLSKAFGLYIDIYINKKDYFTAKNKIDNIEKISKINDKNKINDQQQIEYLKLLEKMQYTLSEIINTDMDKNNYDLIYEKIYQIYDDCCNKLKDNNNNRKENFKKYKDEYEKKTRYKKR